MRSCNLAIGFALAILPAPASAGSFRARTKLRNLPEWFSRSNRIVAPYEISRLVEGDSFWYQTAIDEIGPRSRSWLTQDVLSGKKLQSCVLAAKDRLLEKRITAANRHLAATERAV